jgi:AbiV family abortive infection protein
MIPGKKTLGKLKAEIQTNAVRLFCDACSLYQERSFASAYALAILSLEELGKLEMVDHICDDIMINPHCNPQEFLDHLFTRPMYFNHKNKQMWASDRYFIKKKRIKEISDGDLDRAKQDALYVGYFNRRIRSPKRITASKAHSEITVVFQKIKDVGDLGFNGFECCSDVQSRAKAKRLITKVERSYTILMNPRMKS